MDNLVLLRVYLQNLTPMQTLIAVGLAGFCAGLWFFSDRLNNKSNAIAFIFSFVALAVMLYIGYHLAIISIQTPQE